MTKKLEDLFDINPAGFIEGEEEIEVCTELEVSKSQLRELDTTLDKIDDTPLDKIDAALPTVRDINTSDVELDRLSKLAEDSFEQLLELGLNMEPMRSSEVLSTAAALLGHAISAKNAKVNNKLRVVQLQIQKARLDLQALKMGDDSDPIDGESTLLSRNSILDAILKQKK